MEEIEEDEEDYEPTEADFEKFNTVLVGAFWAVLAIGVIVSILACLSSFSF